METSILVISNATSHPVKVTFPSSDTNTASYFWVANDVPDGPVATAWVDRVVYNNQITDSNTLAALREWRWRGFLEDYRPNYGGLVIVICMVVFMILATTPMKRPI